MRKPIVALLLLATVSSGPAWGGDHAAVLDPASLLPPEIPWSGESLGLVADPQDRWLTPAEESGFSTTPSYVETMDWIRDLIEGSPRLQLLPMVKSWEGRVLWLVVASSNGAKTPQDLRANGNPTLLAQAGIHAGEIDGKDAGLMLLRDLAHGKLAPLLERVNFLFIPILNVDGHERVSTLSRINQRGPDEMGWRTNARNLNLNRDYAKLDAPETRGVVQILDLWQPDLYLDLHVTDGVDKQHDVTWGHNGSHAHSPAIGEWLETSLSPALTRDLRAKGHLPGPHVFVFDRTDLARGIWLWEGGPRYSDGYGSTRHIATVLVENHSLKPYRQRVLGTRVLLQSALETLAETGEALRKATESDRSRNWPELPLGWSRDEEPQGQRFEFPAVKQRLGESVISGDKKIQWTGEPVTIEVPIYKTTQPIGSVVPPVAYWVPAAWSNVIERLVFHGVEMESLAEPREIEVEMYRLGKPEYGEEPYEGRLRVTSQASPTSRKQIFAPGSVRVPVDQPLGVLVALLLEPESPDSFFQWGLFNSIFQRTEYAEAYVLEPLAEQMLENDPALKEAFEKRLAEDDEFAASPRQRLTWFYERSPLVDTRWRLYPVARELP